MRCPRCASERIQRDYDDAMALARLAGVHKLLCNNCGLVFKGFDPLGKLRRAPAKEVTRQRSDPRYSVHLPTAISLIEGTTQNGRVTYSEPSRAHCETISKSGMGLTLVGTKFGETELSRIGRLLFVRVNLPTETLEAVTSIVNYQRIGEHTKRKWCLGVKIQQISDEHKANLLAYLKERARAQPLIISD